jgi:hypothetical protein
MAKTNKNSTKLPNLANTCGVEERLRRLLESDEDGNNFPVTAMFIHNLSTEIIEWADKPDSVLIKDFRNPRGYSDDKIERWAKAYREFNVAYNYAKEVIGARRERKRIMETNCAFTLGDVNKEWQAREDRLHQRKIELATATKQEQQPTTINLFTRAAEDCPEVPHAPAEIHFDEPRD